MNRGVVNTVAGLLALGLVATAGGGEPRLARHDIEDLLASGFSSKTIEAIVRQAPWKVALSDADLLWLKTNGLDDGVLTLLRERRIEPAEPITRAGLGSPATVIEAPRGYGYATSGLGPCSCGNDPVCLRYCLALASGNRGFWGSPFGFGGGGHHHHPSDHHDVGHGSAGHGHHFGASGHGGHGGH